MSDVTVKQVLARLSGTGDMAGFSISADASWSFDVAYGPTCTGEGLASFEDLFRQGERYQAGLRVDEAAHVFAVIGKCTDEDYERVKQELYAAVDALRVLDPPLETPA